MPVLIEGAVDVVLILGICVLIGMLMAVQHTFVPLLTAIGNLDSHIPGIGKPFKGITNSAVNAINDSINKAIAASSSAVAELWAGLVWSIRETGNALEKLATTTENAFGYLLGTRIPSMIKAQIHNAEVTALGAESLAVGAAHDAAKALSDAETFTRQQITKVAADIVGAEQAAKVYAATTIAAVAGAVSHDAQALIHDLDTRLSSRIGSIEGSIEAKVAGAISVVEKSLRPTVTAIIDDALGVGGAIDDEIKHAVAAAVSKALVAGAPIGEAVTHAIDAAIHDVLSKTGSVEALIQSDIARAVGAIVTVGGVTLPQVQDLITRAVAGVAGAVGISRAEVQGLIDAAIAGATSTGGTIGQLVDDVRARIEDELGKIDLTNLASVGAAAAAATALLALTLTETGLDKAECRTKVKGICGTNSTDWVGLLTGIAAFGTVMSIEEVVTIGREIVSDLAIVGDDLGGLF